MQRWTYGKMKCNEVKTKNCKCAGMIKVLDMQKCMKSKYARK